MLTWCMAYPWMTLTIVIFALIVLDNVVDNISNAIVVRAKYKNGQENDRSTGR